MCKFTISKGTEVLFFIKLHDARTKWTFSGQHPVNVACQVDNASCAGCAEEQAVDLVHCATLDGPMSHFGVVAQ